MPDGRYRLQVAVFDSQGNSARAGIWVTIANGMSVPTIDLAHGLAGRGARARARRSASSRSSATASTPALIEEVAARSRAFFDRPDEEKERFRAPAETPGRPVYRPLGAEKLGANADRKASLDWGPSLPGVAWPDDELRAPYERYYAEMLRVADV